MIYVVVWSVFLVLFYMLLWWLIRRTPVTGDDDKEVSRISRLLKRVGDKYEESRSDAPAFLVAEMR